MSLDLLNTPCMCGLGTYKRGPLTLRHQDPPNVLRCTFCRIPIKRFTNPHLDSLRYRKEARMFRKATALLLVLFTLGCRNLPTSPTAHLLPEAASGVSKREACRMGLELLDDEKFECQRDK